MNLGIATLIGNELGKFCNMDMEESGRAWGASLRIRVAIKITNPLIHTTLGRSCLFCSHMRGFKTFVVYVVTLVMSPKFASFVLKLIFKIEGRRHLMVHGFALRLILEDWLDKQGPGHQQQSSRRVEEAQSTDPTPLDQFQSDRETNIRSSPTASLESTVPDTRTEDQQRHMIVDVLGGEQQRAATQEPSFAHQATTIDNGDCVLTNEFLVQVPIRCSACARIPMVRRGRGQRRAMRYRVNTHKRNCEAVLPVAEGRRDETWQLLRRLSGFSNQPWLCAGDFETEEIVDDFRACLSDCQSYDLGYVGDKFTWCNHREAPATVHVLLDRIPNSSSSDGVKFSDLRPYGQEMKAVRSLFAHYGVVGQVNQQGNFDAGIGGMEARVSDVMNETLTKPFSLDEIKSAIFQMRNPRPMTTDSQASELPIDFCQERSEVLKCVGWVLSLFEKASGLKVNLEKSPVAFSRNTSNTCR
ncbi:UNVERIFIED_CONTAM: hypothetical protein Slati_3716000 [Sesamum latifolium]|uniref:Uncharacterized protein n=1 Tax=Sesamum latifolium TaxID=2727402 RepID=A0AAW2U370_9LAMI